MPRLFTPANLHVGGIADKRGALNCVFFTPTGETFATDRVCMIVVEPCKYDSKDFGVQGIKPVDVREEGMAVPCGLISDALKAVPRAPLRHIHSSAVLTRGEDVVEFSSTPDGVNVKRNSGNRVRVPIPDHESFMRGLGRSTARYAGSLKRLKKIVEVLDKMCGGRDEQPVYLEIGKESEPLLLRTQSFETGQRIVAVIGSVTNEEEDEWLKMNKWERGLRGKGATPKREPVVEEGQITARREV